MFQDFSNAVHSKFVELSKNELFVVEAEDIFDRYLSYFPVGSDPIFRNKTFHTCQCCRHFLRRLGIVVGIKDGKMQTVWENLGDLPEPYGVVAASLDSYIKSLPIKSVFRTKEQVYGTPYNYDSKTNQKYFHFHGRVDNKHYSTNPEEKIGEKAAIYQVFQRGLNEIKEDDIDSVLELIDNNALYRGSEHKESILGFKELLKKFRKSCNRDLFIWSNLENRNSRFRNTVIGTLLTDLAEGKDLEIAVKSFESKVAPANYKRPTSLITQRMVEDAVTKLNELNLGAAIYRRYARLSDVSVNDVLFVDNSVRSTLKDGVAAILEGSVKKSSPKVAGKATPISADDFIKDVIPGAKTLEVLVENRHVGNFVTLTGSDDKSPLFKWNNPFAWSYDGDVADSVKQRVKAAGGNVNADLRVSLSWFNFDDLDLHCMPPNQNEIYFRNKQNILDVDMNAGGGTTRTPVENLAFIKPQDGVYRVWVHQFQRREVTDFGFSIEVECQGELNQYSYGKVVTGNVECFTLTVKKGKVIDIKTSLTGGVSSQEKWGVKTESLVPVSSVMFSPNYWGDNAVGARHLIFALKGCKNDQPCRGIYNEFLRSDLDKHRKVFEVLGAKTKCKVSEDQVSGVGFTSARGDSVTVCVDGKRSYCVSF